MLKKLFAWHGTRLSQPSILISTQDQHRVPPIQPRHPVLRCYPPLETPSIMGYDNFEYPPVPDNYSNIYSTSGPFDTYNSHYTPAFEHQAETEPFSYPYYKPAAAVSSPVSPQQSFYADPAFGNSTIEQATTVPGPVFSLRHGLPTSPTSTGPSPSLSDITNTNFVPHSVKTLSKKRPRGTTGSVVCDKCGGRFTVNSSLNRHNKICRGRKPSKKQPNSTQRKSPTTKNEGFMRHTDASHIPREQPGHDAETLPISTSGTVAVFLGSGNATSVSDFTLPESFFERPASD